MATPRTVGAYHASAFAGLAVGDIFVIQIAHLADRGHAIQTKSPHFPEGSLTSARVAFFAEQLRRAAGRAHHLRALARSQLQVVHLRAGRNERSGSALPGRMSAPSPVCTVMPTSRPIGCRM
jgi:hypothetical protein